MDVCSYRVSTPDGRPTIEALSNALISFQNLFSITFDAIKNGPKARARLSEKVTSATAFRFGYTFPGSVGVVFTLPNERLLPTLGTELDISMNALLDLSKLDTPEKVSQSVKQYGEAVIRATYKWAKVLSEHALTVGLEWIRDKEAKTKLLIQEPESHRLYNVIEQSGEERTDTFSVLGMLSISSKVL